MSASTAGSEAAAAAPAAQLPFEDWASMQRRRALRDGAWKIRCEEHHAAGVVTRSVSTWHQAEPGILVAVGSRNTSAVLHGGRVRLAGNPEPRLRVRRSASKRSEGARHRLLPSSQSRMLVKGEVLSDPPSTTGPAQMLLRVLL